MLDAVKQELDWNSARSGWALVRVVLALLPPRMFPRLRTRILRMWGLPIGRGSILLGTPDFSGMVDPRRQFKMGRRCVINWPVYLDVNAPITIGDQVNMGHHVVIITADHAIGTSERRGGEMAAKPVVIESGAWIGARATILPGVTIGAGAVVSAGTVVGLDVRPHTVVMGNPARVVRSLQPEEPREAES